ncbi:hypothetical protein MYP_2069 [Sporocytophaga myxococcoides]|uniref:Uncharacterized protein n=1 Tax=Sporocytophaga myxococcoides TaxID=153721 RepID=A0A098LD50_9BACT|nr:hypothetical protein MYP_2069 [Sporocytophaga myxococcoides]
MDYPDNNRHFLWKSPKNLRHFGVFRNFKHFKINNLLLIFTVLELITVILKYKI